MNRYQWAIFHSLNFFNDRDKRQQNLTTDFWKPGVDQKSSAPHHCLRDHNIVVFLTCYIRRGTKKTTADLGKWITSKSATVVTGKYLLVLRRYLFRESQLDEYIDYCIIIHCCRQVVEREKNQKWPVIPPPPPPFCRAKTQGGRLQWQKAVSSEPAVRHVGYVTRAVRVVEWRGRGEAWPGAPRATTAPCGARGRAARRRRGRPRSWAAKCWPSGSRCWTTPSRPFKFR